MTTHAQKVGTALVNTKKFLVAEGVGLMGLGCLFAGCWLQFGLGIALIVNGVLFVATAVASAFRG